MKPVLIDGFCCAGGATKGYQRAGFYVIGVDINPQPNYCGDEFVQADALDVLTEVIYTKHYAGRRIAAVHTSPPCQPFSPMSACRPGLADEYPDLIAATRALLQLTDLPYVIENVPNSPVRPDLVLCGQMFGLELYRHRLFESNVPLAQPRPSWVPFKPQACGWGHPIPASRAGHWTPGTVMSVAGHVSPMWKAREVMGGIDWMNRDELAESIPPVMAQYVGEHIFAHVTGRIAA